MTCYHCGSRGPWVRPGLTYVGGQGYVPIIQCTNIPACWRRWEKEKP